MLRRAAPPWSFVAAPRRNAQEKHNPRAARLLLERLKSGSFQT
jgi:hypothetical protein